MDTQPSPFLKQLVSSDPAVRDRALAALRTYLTSGRAFSSLELLQLWKGLYYSLYHTPLFPASQSQARGHALLAALWNLHLAVPAALALPFATAFWTTVATLTPQLDAHRLDKFLALQRRMLNAQVTRLARFPAASAGADAASTENARTSTGNVGEDAEGMHGTRGDVPDWIAMMGAPLHGPLGAGGAGERVGDGVRYHVLDVLVDELEKADAKEGGLPPGLAAGARGLVRSLAAQGRTKAMRRRAEEALEDARWGGLVGDEAEGEGEGEDEWGGIEE